MHPLAESMSCAVGILLWFFSSYEEGSYAQLVHACIKSIAIFSSILILRSHDNMRLHALKMTHYLIKVLFCFWVSIKSRKERALSEDWRDTSQKICRFNKSKWLRWKVFRSVKIVFEDMESKYDDEDSVLCSTISYW